MYNVIFWDYHQFLKKIPQWLQCPCFFVVTLEHFFMLKETTYHGGKKHWGWNRYTPFSSRPHNFRLPKADHIIIWNIIWSQISYSCIPVTYTHTYEALKPEGVRRGWNIYTGLLWQEELRALGIIKSIYKLLTIPFHILLKLVIMKILE